jgi:hypothetical protein
LLFRSTEVIYGVDDTGQTDQQIQTDKGELMKLFTIDNDNIVTAYASADEVQTGEGIHQFASQKELERLAQHWPGDRLVEVWNGFAGAPPFGELKPVRKFTDRKSAFTRIWKAIQRLDTAPAAQPEPAAAPKKAKSPAAKGVKDAKPAARDGSKKAIVLDMIRRPEGASLKEIMDATDWQSHYADVRIMPTCVGNPVCGAGIAAMESA